MVRGSLIGVFAALNLVLFFSLFDVWIFQQTLDKSNILRQEENLYSYPLRLSRLITASDRLYDNHASRLVVYEDSVPLGPGHSLLNAIGEAGTGRYSHWGDWLFFSSSDNSNPATNGHVYSVAYPLSPPFYVLIFAFIPLVVAVLGIERTVRQLMPRAAFVLLGIIIVVVPFELFLRTDYAKLHLIGAFNDLPASIQPTLNTKGYRDAEHTVSKPSDRVRILILGDSMTFGWGIADKEIYPKLLADLAGPDVEVISLAQNGWSTADELAALKREGLNYQPDLVVVGAVTNDPAPPTTEPSGQQPEWVLFKQIPLNLQFLNFMDYYLNRVGDILHLKYTYAEWEEDIFDPRKQYRSQWEHAVEKLHDLLEKERIPSYVFILISPVQPESDVQMRKYNALYEVFSKAGFRTTNLHPAYVKEFGDKAEKSLWALPDDSHPGAAINKFFAEEMWKVLKLVVKRLAASSGQSEIELLRKKYAVAQLS